MDMNRDREKQAVQEKLERCRNLAREYTYGVTARNLKGLVEELEQKLHQIEVKPSTMSGKGAAAPQETGKASRK